jgi:hypothetical protein
MSLPEVSQKSAINEAISAEVTEWNAEMHDSG